MPPRADHMGLTVEDMETMLGFYRDVLGFEVALRASSGEEIHTEPVRNLVGIEDADVEVAFLDAPGCSIELVKYNAPPGETLTGVSNNDVGAQHNAFAVDDIDEWYERMEDAENVTTTSPPQDIGFTPRFYLEDPEGNVVELLETE